MNLQVAMMPCKCQALKKNKTVDALIDMLEKSKASIRAKVEDPYRLFKCQFGNRRTWYQVWVTNTAQCFTLYALSNWWMVRKRTIRTAEW
jgi:IS5 family transposase